MAKFYVCTVRDGFVEVEGKKVILPKFEEFEFFLCRQIHNDGIVVTPKKWNVTEASTGWAINSQEVSNKERTTQKKAVDQAIRVLNESGKDKIHLAIKHNIAHYGMSPYYN
jgi:hypothetical protein